MDCSKPVESASAGLWSGLHYLIPSFHVLHVEGAFVLLIFLVLLLLAAAFLADAEAAGEEQKASNHGNGDDSPGWHCGKREKRGGSVTWTQGHIRGG